MVAVPPIEGTVLGGWMLPEILVCRRWVLLDRRPILHIPPACLLRLRNWLVPSIFMFFLKQTQYSLLVCTSIRDV